VYDINKNGIWDTGLVLKGIQPEHMYNEPQELSIRANWERVQTVAIPKESEIPAVVPVPVAQPKPSGSRPTTEGNRPGSGSGRPSSGSGRSSIGTRPNT
jgi:hypothetical protein